MQTGKRRVKKQTKIARAVVGLSLAELREKRSQTVEQRKVFCGTSWTEACVLTNIVQAQRDAQLREIKEKKKTAKATKKKVCCPQQM